MQEQIPFIRTVNPNWAALFGSGRRMPAAQLLFVANGEQEWAIQTQKRYCRPAGGRQADQVDVFPEKMVIPALFARIE